jgi:cytochrome c oxidase subunit 3
MAQGRVDTVRAPGVLGVGTVVWLASELMFFAGLFAAWYALRAANPGDWPPAGVDLDPLRTGVATAVLVGSSFTMHRAVSAAEQGRRQAAVRLVVLTAALGAVFLVNQGLEYAGFDFRLSSHAYGSIFFLMTGFHGLHVLGGIGLMLVVTAVGTGRSKAPFTEHLTMAEYYWHFVDVVWVAMFATIYLVG